MARITPQQAQQMSQTLSAMTRTLQNIQSGLGSLTPAQRAQLSGALTSLGGTLGTAQQFIGGGGGSTSASFPTPVVSPTLPNKTPEQEYQDKMKALLAKYESVLSERPSQTQSGLSPEERQFFEEEKAQLKSRYEAALESLKRQQEKDKQRLLGRYAAMGFSEPGVIEGPMASEPGIVTKALQETGEAQKRELTNLQQAQAGDLLAITKAEREAERRAKAEETEAFERRQEMQLRNLQDLLRIYQPERFSAGNRVFEKNPLTGEIKDITPSAALQQQVDIVQNGKKYRVIYDAEGREVGKIYLGDVEKPKEQKPTSFQEWVLAGGKEGTGMSYKEWLEWRERMKNSDDLITPPPKR